jgi:peptide/nickel transport system ATP-binding protein
MLLEGRELGFYYDRGIWIFRGVNLAVHSGEIVGLTGPSGCGKTTLARVLAGYDRPVEGNVTIDGRAIPESGHHPVQMLFQHPERAVNPRWRLRRTLTEGWKPDGELLESLGVRKKWLDRWPNELSAGELQRICIARALGPETRFLIADEMTAMLDAVAQAQIWHAVLDAAWKRKLGLLVISHDRHLLRRLCDRVQPWDGF